jgi:hypothetical protein
MGGEFSAAAAAFRLSSSKCRGRSIQHFLWSSFPFARTTSASFAHSRFTVATYVSSPSSFLRLASGSPDPNLLVSRVSLSSRDPGKTSRSRGTCRADKPQCPLSLLFIVFIICNIANNDCLQDCCQNRAHLRSTPKVFEWVLNSRQPFFQLPAFIPEHDDQIYTNLYLVLSLKRECAFKRAFSAVPIKKLVAKVQLSIRSSGQSSWIGEEASQPPTLAVGGVTWF